MSSRLQAIFKNIANCFEDQDCDYHVPQILTLLEEARSLDPHHARIPYWRARAHQALGEYAEAQDCLRQAYALDPLDNEIALELAYTLQETDIPQARSIFQSIAERDPQCLPAWQGCIQSWRLEHNRPQAQTVADRLVAALPQQAQAYTIAADAYMAHYISEKNNEPEKIIEYLNTAIALEPRNPDHYNLRYFANMQIKNYEAALIDLEQQRLWQHNSMLDYYFIQTYLALKQYENALTACQAWIASSPYGDGGYSRRAEVYLEMGDYPAALADLKTAMQKTPRHEKSYRARIYSLRAEVYCRQGNTAEALDAIEKAMETTDLPMVSMHFCVQKAEILLAAARKEDAYALLQQILVKSAEHLQYDPSLQTKIGELLDGCR